METKQGLSQEGIKLLACVTMLIDHLGAALFPAQIWMRLVGRIAFPIYCYLLAEGVYYTRNPKKYGLRLAVGMLLAEWPFDTALCGGWTWQHQSVMVTLLLGFGALVCMQRTDNWAGKLMLTIPFALAAEFTCTDYGGWGVLLIAMFGITRGMPRVRGIRAVALLALCGLLPSAMISVGGIRVSVELFAVLALLPISMCHGRKRTHNKVVQWGFNLFYPVHLFVIAMILKIR